MCRTAHRAIPHRAYNIVYYIVCVQYIIIRDDSSIVIALARASRLRDSLEILFLGTREIRREIFAPRATSRRRRGFIVYYQVYTI